jgi:hypothetical protein
MLSIPSCDREDSFRMEHSHPANFGQSASARRYAADTTSAMVHDAGTSSPWSSSSDGTAGRVLPARNRGWPASGPGRLWPVPWSLAGGDTEAPRSRVAEGHFRRKRKAPLTVEGCRRTLSGPSPARRSTSLYVSIRIRRDPGAWLQVGDNLRTSYP